MTWFKVDDNFALHPKALMAGNAALGGWCRAGAWSAQQLTDGAIPAAILPLLGMRTRDAAALVDAGLWERTATGYQFHAWEEYQPTREQVESERDAARKRQQEWRDRQRDKRDRNGVTDSVTNGVTNGTPTRPDPTRPVVPTELPSPPTGDVRELRTRRAIPDVWRPSDETAAAIKAEHPHLDLTAEHVVFSDYWRGTGKPMKDWEAVWRNWMRRAAREARPSGRSQTQLDSNLAAWDAWAAEEDTDRKAIGQ